MTSVSDALAIAHQARAAGRLAEAEQLYRQILAIEPDQPDALHALGVLAYRSGRADVAVEHICRAIQKKPDDAEFHNSLGVAYRRQKLLSQAAECHRRAIELKANFAAAHFNLGNALADMGEVGDAARAYKQAMLLRPDYADGYIAMGHALNRHGKSEEAVACGRRAVELKPNDPHSHNLLGDALRHQDKSPEAEHAYRRALELNPDFTPAHLNLGILLFDHGRLSEAAEHYVHVLRYEPDCAEALNNLGNALSLHGQREKAVAYYRRAIKLQPEFAPAHLNLSGALLIEGDLARGWPEYEWRLKSAQMPVRKLPWPRWQGEPLAGKTIFVWAEQGLGDTIQFVRYLGLLKELGASVIFECQQPLLKLLANVKGMDRLLGPASAVESQESKGCGDRSTRYDYQAPLLSLPGLFKTTLATIPAGVPYLFADRELVAEWRKKLDGIPGFRIGINWHGRAGMRESQQRDIPVKIFASLADNPGIRLISLQKEESQVESPGSKVKERAFVDVGEFDTAHGAFMDTAAIMMNLDLVITSDTSVAHVAGALGVPVWVALPLVPDWRWLLNRSDSPWYPTMRLFRQKRLGDWNGVFDEIREALTRHLNGE